MKTLLLMLFAAFTGVLSSFGQLNTLHNHCRAGDVLIKQQVEYKDPGKAGINQVWDFGKLKTVNDEYTLSYDLPPLEGDSVYILGETRYNKKKTSDNELIVGTEHNTMYYFHLKNDTLLLLGHENPVVRLKYTQPVVMATYPTHYGQPTINMPYKAEGLYSGTEHIQTSGRVSIDADAFGKMILPSGDTINPVLRIRQTKSIENADGSDYSILETYSWYTKGYRYPIFECIRSTKGSDGQEIFATAFFYPPQDHFYLDSDPENQTLLDEMWKVEEKVQSTTTNSIANEPSIILSYKIYPNPVSTQLNIEYTLNEKSDIQILLVASNGNVIRNIQKKNLPEGTHSEKIFCSDLTWGSYHLKLTSGNYTVSQTVIKK